jgi:hypothetical protein
MKSMIRPENESSHVDVRRKAYARGKPPSSRHLSGGAVDASPPDRRRALVLQFH